ncbi:MAG: dps [Gemmataceae bacterium]|nr:dps [Gemmataceae bacterium]
MAKFEAFATKTDLAPEVRERAIGLLNQQLADTLDLYSQTKQARWIVRGMRFYHLHELFDALAESVEEYVDSVAERATALGGTALGTVRMSAAASRLPEYPFAAEEGRHHVEALRTRFAALVKTSRAAIDSASSLGDVATADLFTQVSRGLDTHLWILDLQG